MNSTLRHCQLIAVKPATAGFSLTPMWVQATETISLDSRNYEGNDSNAVQSRGTKGD